MRIFRFWKAACRRLCGVGEGVAVELSWCDDDDGEDVWEDGSDEGACLLLRGRTVYVPVSHIRRDPVAGEAVSMRWFCNILVRYMK